MADSSNRKNGKDGTGGNDKENDTPGAFTLLPANVAQLLGYDPKNNITWDSVTMISLLADKYTVKKGILSNSYKWKGCGMCFDVKCYGSLDLFTGYRNYKPVVVYAAGSEDANKTYNLTFHSENPNAPTVSAAELANIPQGGRRMHANAVQVIEVSDVYLLVDEQIAPPKKEWDAAGQSTGSVLLNAGGHQASLSCLTLPGDLTKPAYFLTPQLTRSTICFTMAQRKNSNICDILMRRYCPNAHTHDGEQLCIDLWSNCRFKRDGGRYDRAGYGGPNQDPVLVWGPTEGAGYKKRPNEQASSSECMSEVFGIFTPGGSQLTADDDIDPQSKFGWKIFATRRYRATHPDTGNQVWRLAEIVQLWPLSSAQQTTANHNLHNPSAFPVVWPPPELAKGKKQ